MYSHKLNVNILTSVLLAHGIEEAVVCPGSRNAPLVHNLHATQRIRLHSVVDERSAAFVAIGLYLQTRRPVVVCVTSGSAVLNTLPGVAEAALRHIPLLIISADRPPEWIGQLDGQTLPQTNALHPYAPCFTLVEPHTADQQWWCERVANEAILATAQRGGQPVQINVPLSEPLLQCTTNELPTVRKIEQFRPQSKHPLPEHIVEQITAAQCPVLVIGQWEEGGIPAVDQLRQRGQLLVYSEDLSQQGDSHTADWLDKGEVSPDLVIHIGGAMVSKHFKLFLRRLENCPVVRISTNEELPDTFCHLQSHVIASPQAALAQLAELLPTKPAVVALAEQIAASAPEPCHFPQLEAIFLGNSMAVRWGNRFFARTAHPIYGNRGTNGIEGSLSVAAGYALAAQGQVLCVIGDLSFFYDIKALWNRQIDGRLRILLINNGRGEIFHRLPALQATPALDQYVAAAHQATARGVAESYDCTYLSLHVDNFAAQADSLIRTLLEIESERPVIYEIFTPNF